MGRLCVGNIESIDTSHPPPTLGLNVDRCIRTDKDHLGNESLATATKKVTVFQKAHNKHTKFGIKYAITDIYCSNPSDNYT